jgi:hypothetical protein
MAAGANGWENLTVALSMSQQEQEGGMGNEEWGMRKGE